MPDKPRLHDWRRVTTEDSHEVRWRCNQCERIVVVAIQTEGGLWLDYTGHGGGEPAITIIETVGACRHSREGGNPGANEGDEGDA